MRIYIASILLCIIILTGQRIWQLREGHFMRKELQVLHQRPTPLDETYEKTLQEHIQCLKDQLPSSHPEASTTLPELTQKLKALGPVDVLQAQSIEPNKLVPKNLQQHLNLQHAAFFDLKLPSVLLANLLETLFKAHYLPKSLKLKALPNHQLEAKLEIVEQSTSSLPTQGPKGLTQEKPSTNIGSKTMSENVTQLSRSTFDDAVKSGIVLVDFWAPWCGPCKAIAPVIDEIADEMAGRISVSKLLIDDNPEIAAKYNVQSIPTLIVFKQGKEVHRSIGLRSKSELVATLETIAANN